MIGLSVVLPLVGSDCERLGGIFAIVALDRVRDSIYAPGSMLLLVYLFLRLFQLSFILVGIELVLEEISKAADVSSVISYSSCCDVPDESLAAVCRSRCCC